jgi:hypothetical protein
MSAPKFMRIATSKLFTDSTYQRARVASKIKRMVAEGWHEEKCEALGVSDRGNGTYAIWNGGHRHETAVALGIKSLPCMVIQGASVEREAEIFVSVNRDRAHMSPISIFKANLRAGDVDTVAIDRVVTNHGFKVIAAGSRDNSIAAVAALESVRKRFGIDVLSEALSLIRTTWNGEAISLQGPFIIGMSRFLFKSGLSSDQKDKLVTKLRRKLPSVLLRQCRTGGADCGQNPGDYFAKTVASVYNERIGEGAKVDIAMFDKSARVAAGWATRKANDQDGAAGTAGLF